MEITINKLTASCEIGQGKMLRGKFVNEQEFTFKTDINKMIQRRTLDNILKDCASP